MPQGEYEIEGFFTRLNHLLRDQHAEILVTRTTALPVHVLADIFGGQGATNVNGWAPDSRHLAYVDHPVGKGTA